MFILSTVVPAVVLLNNFGLFVEELALFRLVLVFFLSIKLATADVTPPDSLHFLCCSFFIVELPFNLEHAPVFLNNDCCRVLFVPILFSFI